MKAFVAFGSNFGERLKNLSEAKRRLDEHGAHVVAASPAYEAEPVDCAPQTQPFLNAVVAVETDMTPVQLLAVLQQIEERMGRAKTRPKNSPRRIDLDLLSCGDVTAQDERLTLPHPRMFERRFVLQPLADIAPNDTLPGADKTVAQWLAQLEDAHWIRLFAADW